MAKNKLNSKSFFSIVVLSVAVLGTMLFTFSAQQKTNTQSEATGDNTGSLINCTLKNGYAGGIQLFNGPNNTGGYRTMCLPAHYSKTAFQLFVDPDLGADTGVFYDHDSIYKIDCTIYKCGGKYSNIWNFDNKTESAKLRVNPGCTISGSLYDLKKVYGDFLLDIGINNDNGTKARIVSKNLYKSKVNRASVMEFDVICKP